MLIKPIIICIFIFLIVSISNAVVPQLINYQGWLVDKDGGPLNETVSIQFRIYDQETEGSALWSETQSVTVVDGIFSILLGSVTPIPYSVFNGDGRYLALQVGNDSEMTPRKRLVSVGYSFRAHNSDNLNGKDASSYVQSVNGVGPKTGNIDLVAGSNVAITPDSSNNQITISATPGGGGDNLGNHTATQNIKLNEHWLSADGDPEGVYIDTTGHVGIGTMDTLALLTVRAKGRYGIWGFTDNINGTGVHGWGLDIGMNGFTFFGVGVLGKSANYLGVYGESDNYTGVFGKCIKSGNWGSLGTENLGVFGKSIGTPNMSRDNNQQSSYANGNYGVYGEHGNGNYGYIGGETYAVYGATEKESGYLGGAYGVFGKKATKWGYIGGSNYAGYFNGDVHVTGVFSNRGGKAFKIDHPLEPGNKYLYHYCTESNELANIYSGNVTLDASGEATVDLPEWFEALNTDFRYQLTCIGSSAIVYISEEISGNHFKIAGGKPGMKISWQVTGVRNDVYARMHPVEIEKRKEGDEVGKYLHPEEFGMPESLGINYEERNRIEEEAIRVGEERQRIIQNIKKMEEENKRFHDKEWRNAEYMR